jgi:SAM-dependent methyltransferase
MEASRDYIFKDSKDRAEYDRLLKIQEAFDPITQQILTELGYGAGVRALEIGPGAGSMLRWMCEQAGPAGEVTALDLNTRFVKDFKYSNLKLKEGDVKGEALPQNYFDFIHARYVLIHIQESKPLIARLAQSLRPGGYLLLEEPDFTPAKAMGEAKLVKSFDNIHAAIDRLYASMQLDPAYGGKLTDLLKECGLAEVTSQVWAEQVAGGTTVAEMMKQSATFLQDKYIQTGAVTKEDIAHYCELAANPAYSALYYASVSAWGKKPISA